MRIEKTHVNTLIRNKVNNKNYLIVGEKNEGFVVQEVSGTNEALAYISGEAELEGEKILMTKNNAIMFKFIKDLTPPEVPKVKEYQVKDGILLRGECPVTKEQGEITIEEILGAIQDFLIIIGKGIVYTYNPVKDKFCEVYRLAKGDIVEYNVIKITDTYLDLNVYVSNKITVKEDGKEDFEEEHVVTSEIVSIKGDTVNKKTIPGKLIKTEWFSEGYCLYLKMAENDILQEKVVIMVNDNYYDVTTEDAICIPVANSSVPMIIDDKIRSLNIPVTESDRRILKENGICMLVDTTEEEVDKGKEITLHFLCEFKIEEEGVLCPTVVVLKTTYKKDRGYSKVEIS